MDYNVTKYPYIPCPSFLVFIYETVAWITICFSTLIYILVVYIVVKKSPKEIGTYKWYILWNSSVTYLFDFMYGLCHPEPLMPYPIMVFGGLGRHVDFGNFAPIYGDIAILAVISCFYGTTMMFLYRYCQTRQSILLKIFSNGKFAIPLHLLAHIVATCLIIVPFHLQWAPEDELKGLLQKLEPETYQRVKNSSVVGFLTNSDGPQIYYIAVYSIVFLSSCLAVVVLFCIFQTYKTLVKIKANLSKKTYQLYKTLINALVIEMILAGGMVFMPLIVTIGAFLLSFCYTSIIAMLSLLCASLFPTVLHLLTLFYVAPYKRAVIRMFKKIQGKQVEATTTYDLTRAPIMTKTVTSTKWNSISVATTMRSHSIA